MRFASVFLLALIISGRCFSQQPFVERPVNGPITEKGDSSYRPVVRRSNSYFGVQVNQLLNQLFNFGNTTAAVSNPYLLNYSVNARATGWGFNSGLGYNISTSSDDSNPQAQRKTSVNNFNLRAGPERKMFITKKWLGAFGFDVVYGRNTNNTTTSSDAGFSKSSTEIKATTSSIGCGLRAGLNYFIVDKIMLGTELTYYYRSNKTSQTTSNFSQFTDPNTGQVTSQSSHEDTKFTNADLTLRTPISVFLVIKL